MVDKKNVVLVTIDSIRYDRCGFAGTESVSTPTFDRMARQGLNFRDAIAPGAATPDSVPVTLTGEFPPMKTDNAYLNEWVQSQSGARQTLAERFSKRGYTTGAFTANPWASRYFGFDKGFDYFEDFFVDSDSNRLFSGAISDDSILVEASRNVHDWVKGQNMFMSWEAFYDDVTNWTGGATEPYFVWLFLVDVHVPYYAGSEYRTQSNLLLLGANLWLFFPKLQSLVAPFDDVLLKAYDNCIRHTDEFLRRLEQDVSNDDTLIAVHGDHGDEFGEFGRYGHGGGLSEPLLHVPFFVQNGPNVSVDETVSLQSLPDILLDLATENTEIGEVSNKWSEQIAVSWIEESVSIRTSDWKYIHDTSTDTGELYRVDALAGTEELWKDPPEPLVRGVSQLAESAHRDRLEKRRIAEAAEATAEDSTL
ncbi:sulfatase [Haloarcula nitratireducens]|uniref:Sulfatase n=1 Tax=Haloarcula nitratireducens TaxID=2487749 RepID=A0AAW4PJ28_9EURY|nr:sulfatase [Halomicroarcula nitratireducens]MBX0297757.1 sulfatase [Halomicroarcula nitratireducens]